ncbi:MAG: radical SAM protein, partial [Lachnospiraceae bacterium]|nr:radical SAM protein [Lachnospiraceae bacterium]
MKCTVCPHQCDIKEGQSGICHARTCTDGAIVLRNYGQVTSLALDPIEKKPLNRFFPGSWILSLGSWGCNLNCPWCQNDSISRGEDWAGEAGWRSSRRQRNFIQLTPEEVVEKAKELTLDGNIGIAFTYNEPMICPEFLTDTAKLAREANLKNVLVTNGMITQEAHETFLPYIDAYNIDLKTSSAENYRAIGGDLDAIVDT